ncbi:hypothetical protein AAHE18_12G121500 [Arachis hypogaea]
MGTTSGNHTCTHISPLVTCVVVALRMLIFYNPRFPAVVMKQANNPLKLICLSNTLRWLKIGDKVLGCGTGTPIWTLPAGFLQLQSIPMLHLLSYQSHPLHVIGEAWDLSAVNMQALHIPKW